MTIKPVVTATDGSKESLCAIEWATADSLVIITDPVDGAPVQAVPDLRDGPAYGKRRGLRR